MASGDVLAIFPASFGIPTSSNGATMDFRNLHPIANFDGSTDESLVFSYVLDDAYAGGGLTVTILWSCAGTSGDVDWDVSLERIGVTTQDIDSDGFAAVNSTDGTSVPGTSGQVEDTDVTFTDGADMDSVAAGEQFRIKVTRDASADTNSNDVELHFVIITET